MAESFDPAIVAAATEGRAWPFEEARRVIARLDKIKDGAEKTVVFQTGYGPSGLPHIGTFGEVARTSMVRHAFRILTGDTRKTRLICFSDDLDGLRKVPDNAPNKAMLEAYLGKPLSAIPDPFCNEHASFADHNNSKLRDFLDMFGFEYEFFSASECYRAGMMDATLLRMLDVYDKVMDIILPTLGPERRATYSPFLPISPASGIVLQVPMIERDVKAGTVVYIDPDTAKKVETKVTGGAVKCQWKADWAMRWAALGVDYEMSGKDLMESVKLSSQICRALGATPPEGFTYELFLDAKGQKISKSKGNGMTIEEWLKYASPSTLGLYMFQRPKAAKRLHWDVIPRAVDEYIGLLAKYRAEEPKAQIENPAWHLHAGHPPAAESPISFALLLNLVSVSNAETKDQLWSYIRRYQPETTPERFPMLDQLVGYALAYFMDEIKPKRVYRAATEKERGAITALIAALAGAPADASAEDLQTTVYAIGKENGFAEDLRSWFQAIYEVALGDSQGPRFGSFIALYGIEPTRKLLTTALQRK